MDDVIYIYSSPAPRDPSHRVNLGVVEITDSEPEDLGNDDLLWTGPNQETTQAGASSHRHKNGVNKDGVKEGSPMDVDSPAVQAGPSSYSPPLDPFPDAPPIHFQSEVDPQETDQDPYSKHLSLVLEVIPDVLPQHALELIERLYPAYGDQVGEWVVQNLFENAPYPKVEDPVAGKRKGKRKASEMEDATDEPPLKVKIDFTTVDRPKPTGKNYRKLSLNQLYTHFPYIPVTHIRRVFASKNALYTPTHIKLTAEMQSDPLPFTLKTVKTNVSMGKGKQKEMRDEDFEKERAQLLHKDIQVTQDIPDPDEFLQNQAPGDVGTSATDLNAPFEDEGCVECGCCFSPAPFHNMIQCPDAHLFCTECMIAYASNLLGEHNFKIVCMDQSGCKLSFPESELKRFLTPKLLSLYDKVRQAKEIEMAGLDGLEECPHCDFKVVIDNPDERLFRCQNEDCGAVTCRECKKPDHLPKSCVEVDEDKKIDARHVVEEAMTNALLRNCPKCNKVFIKESGCNKMTCPNCMTLSCYVCRQIITGYEHFNEARPGQPQRAGQAGKCLLWDKVEERHEKEVEDAQKQAIAEYRMEHPEMGEDMLKVELPKATTGEASGSVEAPRRRARPPPVYERIEPLRHVLERHRPLVAVFRRELARNPDDHPPQPEPDIPQLDPAMVGQHPREIQEILQRHVEIPNLERQPEPDDWVHRRRVAQQQRVIRGRFAGGDLRNQRPAAPPDAPAPRIHENRRGGARMDPVDRGRVDQWRRRVVDPGDGAAL